MAAKANPEGIKWPTDKPRYDKNYLRLYGKKCPVCTGRKEVLACWKCGGIGYVERGK